MSPDARLRALLTSALLLIYPPPAPLAQAHPCDETPPTVFQVRRADQVRLAWCQQSIEDDGITPIPLGAIHFYAVDPTRGVTVFDLGLPQPTQGPNAAGYYLYESTARTFAADLNLVVVAEYNGIQSAPSGAILVDVRGGPKSPLALRLLDVP